MALLYELLFRPGTYGEKTLRNQLIQTLPNETIREISQKICNFTVRESNDPDVIDDKHCIRRGIQRAAGKLGGYTFHYRMTVMHSIWIARAT